MSSIVTEAVLQGFDDLAEDIGVEAHFLPPILAVPAESTYIAELQIGGQYQDVDGGVTVRKDKLPKTLQVGGTFWIGGAKVKIEDISTTATDPLMHIAYSILTAPQAVPSTQDDEPSVIIYGGNADTPGGDPGNSLNFWIVKVIQPLNGGTISLHHQNGDPVTAESLQEGSVIEVRIDTGENIELVTWLGDLQQWGTAGSFLHTVNSHLTVTAETSPLLIQVYTDTPEQGGSFNWQTGHTHEAGQSLTLTYTPPSPQHTLSHFQINGETVAHGQVTDFGTLDISGNSIIIPDPRKDLTVEAVLEMDCPLAEPTLIGGVNAPDPLPMPGNEATYTANIPEGQELVRWELDGETIPHNENGSVTITQPAGEFTLEAVLQTITYTLTTPATPAGSIHLSNYNPEHGEEVTLTFYPATGYGDTSGFQIGDFYTPAPNNSTTWLADKDAAIGVDAEILTFTITATGENLTFTLQDGNGDPITNPVDYGTEVNVTAIPAEGYEFLNWTGHPVITNTGNNPVQFTADQDAALEAFAQQVAEPTLIGGVNAPDPLPMPGNEATYTVNIPEGQELVRWELDGETIPHNQNGSVTITQPAGEFTLEVFLQVITYTLTTPTTPAGNIHLSNYNPEHGEEVTLTFYPATGYGDTSGFQIGDFYTPAPNNSTTWLADKDAAIGVDAEILTFTITATGDNLTFALQDGNSDPITNPVDYGTEVNVTAIPAEGYEFLNWTGHPVITNTGNNPIQFTADQDAALEAFAQQVADFTGTLDITEGNASILNTGTLTGLDTASSFNLTVSGALLHELFGNQDSLRSFQDALYVFWQAGYGDSNQDSEYAFKAPATYNVNPGQRTAESFSQWWKSDLNDLVSLDETIGTSDHQHLVFNPANDAITIANKSLFLAVRFNSTLGFLPLPLLPYLAAGKTFDPGNFIDSWFQDNAGASNLTVTQVKAALDIINAGLPATDTGRFQITKELVDTQGGAALTEYTRDFNPYTFPVNMDAIETALGAGSGRQTSLDFAIVSTGLNVTGNAIDGVNTTNNVHQLIDGGFKLAVDIA